MPEKKIGKFYSELDIRFPFENAEVYALQLSFERFRRSIPSHSHSGSSYEIHYIPYGRGRITLNGAVRDVVPNTLYVTGPHVEHSQIPDWEDPMAEYCVYLKLVRKPGADAKNAPSSLLARFAYTPMWFGQDTQGLHALMQTIFAELERQSVGYIVQVKTLLQQLLVYLVRNYEEEQESAVRFEPSNLTDGNYLIVEECFLYEYASLTLEKLGLRLGLSPRQTERLLSRQYGKTFLQKRTEARMSAAAILLRDRGKKLDDIAAALGYSSAEHFSNAFRRHYNTSPGRYRRAESPEGTEEKVDNGARTGNSDPHKSLIR